MIVFAFNLPALEVANHPFRVRNGGNQSATSEFGADHPRKIRTVSTTYDDANAPDPDRVEEEMHQAVKRCRMVVRKGRQLLELTQTKREPNSPVQ